MGVPKFFRYISERYPCLSEVVKEYQIPEFDNLYLDMNGIIHTCSHPDDGNPHFRISEEKIFQDIFHYIEVLFRMIKPRKLFFMAVDGVAPRAKMNQQRGRRFRSVKEAQTLETKARERGEVLPEEARFDSNCITPGTVFMARLHEQLKYFVVSKISTDKLWQNCKIILSGHETPGEGEHKIMDYIRYIRAQPGYDPNTRHCLYGLDADLIMLGLCTHEPHFSLLREEVKFGKKSNKRANSPEQITFFLLHLSLMREYLELEFYSLKDKLPFGFDLDKIIDDWVLMGFLVGNDFIPHLPNMHIVNGALPILYNAYMNVLPKLGGYINEAGTLNLARFETFIQELGNIDLENFSEKYADLKWFEAKTGRHFSKTKLEKSNLSADTSTVSNKENTATLSEDLENLENLHISDEEVVEMSDCEDFADDDEDDLLNAEFLQHKTDYYRTKLEYQNITPEVLKTQAKEYVRAIQWNLHYYYNGICSWSWYYPHHYAPYISDIKDFSQLTFEFELGKPFKPYEQLLAVLPAASKTLLPEPYKELMVNDDSPIKKYYPDNFKTDLNGKKQEWEAVVLIPFIDEDILLSAMELCNSRLTPEEQQLNSHGPMFIYRYTSEDLGTYHAPQYFPPVKSSHVKWESIVVEDIHISKEKLIKGPYPGAKFDVFYPGFPTMKHLKYEGFLERRKVRVFEQPSRGDNMILKITEKPETLELDVIAHDLLGKTIHVGWPHLVEAMVVSVSNHEFRYHSVGEKGQYNVEENRGNLTTVWHTEKQCILEHYQSRLGIDVGTVHVLVHVKVMVGRKYIFTSKGRVSLDKQWASATSNFPLQTVVSNIAAYEEEYQAYKDITSVFPPGSQCFMLGQPGYGVLAEVLNSSEEGRIKISLKKCEEPDLTPIVQLESDIKVRYMNVHLASTKLGISKGLFSRITGSVFIIPGNSMQSSSEDAPKLNIGLNLKFNKRNEEIPGYSKKDGSIWLYSGKAIDLVRDYMQKFPFVFEYLNCHVGNDMFFEEDMFMDRDSKNVLREITTWIKQQPFYSVERQVCGSLMLDPETIQTLEKLIDEYNIKNCKVKPMLIKVKPNLLFKPDLQIGNVMPDSAATFQLFDRIVNVREGHTVPFGFKGTIIGIQKQSFAKEDDTLYNVLFDRPFVGGLTLNCSCNRGYQMPKPAMINISHGQRIHQQKTGKPGQLSSTLQNISNHVNFNANLKSNALFPSNHGFQPQPPSFGNWKYDRNYSMQQALPVLPMNSFNQYSYNNNPYQPQNSYNYSMNCNVPKPNTFVPYNCNNSNYYPLVPMCPAQSSPTQRSMSVGNYSTNNYGNNSGLKLYQKTVNEKKVSVGETGECKEAKTKIMKNERSIQELVPKHPTATAVGENSSESIQSENKFPKDNSEVLKKILKIPDNAKNSTTVPENASQQENATVLSIDDIFAHARMKEQQYKVKQNGDKIISNHPKPQSKSQKYSIGCAEVKNAIVPKMPVDAFNIDLVSFKPQSTPDAASQVPVLQDDKIVATTAKPLIDAFPNPPKQWQGLSLVHDQCSLQKNWSKNNLNTHSEENVRSARNQENCGHNGNSSRLTFNNTQIYKYLNVGVQKDQNNISTSSSTFVPLQAVRHQNRNRMGCMNTSECSVEQTGTSEHQNHSNYEKEKTHTIAPYVPPSVMPEKPRRERKIRIAANFKTPMTK